uniref:right-handed parallel beta-helix repeat-containing protein n=1 Tax=Bartonella sp. ML70XJBT.G TaxID=3019093 RepID=UPI00235FC142
MYKKSLLSSMATAAIMLFNIQFNVHAESLKVSGEKREVKNATYETLHALEEGQITGTDLKVTGNKDTNSSSNEKNYVISAEGKGSAIKLTGNKTTIKGTDSDIPLGLEAKDDAILQMTGGMITVSGIGVHFGNSNSTENKLENVTISSGKDNTLLKLGITADKSKVDLENVKVTQVKNAVFASNNSTITVNGGSFEAKNDTIYALDGGSIILNKDKKNNVTITSTYGHGLYAEGENSIIKITNGNVTGQTALLVKNKGHIEVEGVTLKAEGAERAGAAAFGDKSLIELKNNTKIESANIGLNATNSSKIKMEGGTITAKNTALSAMSGGHIIVTDSTLKTKSNEGTGALSFGNSSIIELGNNTTIEASLGLGAMSGGHIIITDSTLKTKSNEGAGALSLGNNSLIELHGKEMNVETAIGLSAKDSGAISMTGGIIKASVAGATFENSKSQKNKLENVTISSNKNDALLDYGIKANKSTVILENIKVTQATNAIFADDNSQIAVSGGSFESTSDSIQAKQGSSITLNNATITSHQKNGVYADGSGSKIIITGGLATTKNKNSYALYAKNKGEIEATDVTLTTDGTGTGAFAYGEKSKITLHGNTTINNTFNGLGASVGGQITSENLNIIGGKAINLNTSEMQSGVWVAESGKINLTGTTTISHFDEGLYAGSKGKIVSGNLTITGGESENITIGVESYEDSIIELNGNTIIQDVDIGLAASEDGAIKVGNGAKNENEIEAKKIALAVVNGGHIDLANISATAKVAGFQFANKTDNDPDHPSDPQKYRSSEINLTNTKLHIDNGRGILVGALVEKSIENSPILPIGTLNLKDSEIHADMLLDDGIIWKKTSWKDKNEVDDKKLKEIATGSFTLNADHSTLEGRAKIAQERNVHFDLKNNTQWILKTSITEIDNDGKHVDISQRSRSDVSILNIENSSLIFDGVVVDDHYHTLHIGSGKPDTTAVYNASGNAQISFNTLWSDGKPIVEQKTDRLLINGNVSGKTKILVNLKGNTTQENISNVEKNIRGLSLIQVSGTAEEGSFKLAHGYTTINGSPDKYMLRAYGPNSSQGKANMAQNLLDEKNENFWDFRLQPEFLNSNPEGSESNPENPGSNPSGSGSNSGSNPDPEQNVQEVVPQMASYLLMPNALFYTGLTDMAKQNALLANMRTSLLSKQQEKQSGFFLYTYGGTGNFSSENAPRQYGYSGAHLRYAALQGG